jgi:ribonuclease P protein component
MLRPPSKGSAGAARRVRKRPEFLEIQSSGRRIPTRDFVLIIAPATTPHQPPRLGVTASKRVGNAVRRNRLKRIVRAAFHLLPDLVPPGFDLVVICRRDYPEIGTESTLAQWREVQKRVKKATAQLSSAGS